MWKADAKIIIASTIPNRISGSIQRTFASCNSVEDRQASRTDNVTSLNRLRSKKALPYTRDSLIERPHSVRHPKAFTAKLSSTSDILNLI